MDAAGHTRADLLRQADEFASRHRSGHVVGVGLFPGLSGLLTQEVAAAAPGRRIAVALQQSSNARVGPAGMREMLGMVEPGPGIRRGSEVLLRLEHPEAAALRRSGVVAEYVTRWDSGGQTRAVGALAALGLLPILTRLPNRWLGRFARHRPGIGEEATLTVRAPGSGVEARATARSDYEATAAVLAAVAGRAGALAPGVHRLWETTEPTRIVEEIGDVVTLSARGLALG